MKDDNIISYDERWDKGLMKHMIVSQRVRYRPGDGDIGHQRQGDTKC